MKQQKMQWVLTLGAVALSLTIGKAFDRQAPAPPAADRRSLTRRRAGRSRRRAAGAAGRASSRR